MQCGHSSPTRESAFAWAIELPVSRDHLSRREKLEIIQNGRRNLPIVLELWAAMTSRNEGSVTLAWQWPWPWLAKIDEGIFSNLLRELNLKEHLSFLVLYRMNRKQFRETALTESLVSTQDTRLRMAVTVRDPVFFSYMKVFDICRAHRMDWKTYTV